MTAVITIPLGGRLVLEAVAAGRSPWHRWDDGAAARTPEGQEAYAARARIITACREHGLLTGENLLTERGRDALKSMAALHG